MENKQKRTLVIGDIHGGLRALVQVLIRCNYNYQEDQIIFLGDYVDGWSETAELVQYLIDLREKSVHKPIFLRGNHDKWCEDWLLMGQCPNIWVTHSGGQATIDSYIRTGYITDEAHKQFFRNLQNFYIDEENRGFVHGGFISQKGLGHDANETDYYWDRDLFGLAVMLHGRELEADPDNSGKPNKYTRFRKHKEVYIGHTSTQNWNCKPHYPEFEKMGRTNAPIDIPMNRCNVWNMDTGGGFKGKLTIMDIDTKDYWQSDNVPTLYPEEKGRG